MLRLLWLLRWFGMAATTPQDSGCALAALTLGTGPMAQAQSGSYWQIWKTKPSAENTYDEKLQEDLWDWTIEVLSTEGNGLGDLQG